MKRGNHSSRSSGVRKTGKPKYDEYGYRLNPNLHVTPNPDWDSVANADGDGKSNDNPDVDWSKLVDADGAVYSYKDGKQKVIPPFENMTLRQRIQAAKHIVANETYITPTHTYVRTREHVKDMVNALAILPTDEPWISVDLEADGLGYKSHPAFMQIRDHKVGTTYLVDTLVLKPAVWNAAANDGKTTLRSIFEDDKTPKLMWDCRADSCCLFGQLGIKLGGIVDVQILHLLLMAPAPDFRQGFIEGVVDLANLNPADLATARQAKDLRGHNWEQRPLTDEMKLYAANDVLHLRAMYLQAKAWLTPKGMQLASEWSDKAVSATWGLSTDYVSTESRTPEGFASCWNVSEVGRLRRPLVTAIVGRVIDPNFYAGQQPSY